MRHECHVLVRAWQGKALPEQGTEARQRRRHCSEGASDGTPSKHFLRGTAGGMPPLSAAGMRVLKEVEDRKSVLREHQASASTRLAELLSLASPVKQCSLVQPDAEGTPSSSPPTRRRTGPPPALDFAAAAADAVSPPPPSRSTPLPVGTDVGKLRRQLAEARRAAASARAEATGLRALLLANVESGGGAAARAAAAAAARFPHAWEEQADAPLLSPGETAHSAAAGFSAWAAAESRLRALLLWEHPARSAKVAAGAAYALVCWRWAERAKLHPLPLLSQAGLLYLVRAWQGKALPVCEALKQKATQAYAFVLRRARLLLGRAPPPPLATLRAREAAVREVAMTLSAHAVRSARRAPPAPRQRASRAPCLDIGGSRVARRAACCGAVGGLGAAAERRGSARDAARGRGALGLYATCLCRCSPSTHRSGACSPRVGIFPSAGAADAAPRADTGGSQRLAHVADAGGACVDAAPWSTTAGGAGCCLARLALQQRRHARIPRLPRRRQTE